jgi:hypothetical protein
MRHTAEAAGVTVFCQEPADIPDISLTHRA